MKIPACPKCGSKEVTLIGKRNALYPAVCFLVFGYLFPMLHRLQSPIDFHCDACEKRFSRRYFSEKFALTALIFAILAWIGLGVYIVWTVD